MRDLPPEDRLAIAPGLTLACSTDRSPIAPPPASRAHVRGRIHATLTASTGRVGLDVETLARIAINARPDDPWLTRAERMLAAAATDPIVELACHWVLKEAYGKALGLGLAIPLDRLTFGARRDLIVLEGDAAPPPEAGWRWMLLRRDDLLFGVAHQPSHSGRETVRTGGQEPTDRRAREIQ